MFIYWKYELMGSFSDYRHCGFPRKITIKYNYHMTFLTHSVLIQQTPIECTLQTEPSLIQKKNHAFLTFRTTTRNQILNMYFIHLAQASSWLLSTSWLLVSIHCLLNITLYITYIKAFSFFSDPQFNKEKAKKSKSPTNSDKLPSTLRTELGT